MITVSIDNLTKFFKNKKVLFTLLLIVVSLVSYFQFFHSITMSPVTEAEQVIVLESAKQKYPLSSFSSDGCSGNVSALWDNSVKTLSSKFPSFSDKYSATQQIPFEEACVVHDKVYHLGEGGYIGRLRADNELRMAIIDYSIDNSEEIKKRTGIKSTEEVIFMYEFIAETIYRGVRLGGAPCTGMPYAWGFGYNNGVCN